MVGAVEYKCGCELSWWGLAALVARKYVLATDDFLMHYKLDTDARYVKYKTQLKHNIIQWSCLKHVSYHIHYINQSIQ
jgi:hypothetical protein